MPLTAQVLGFFLTLASPNVRPLADALLLEERGDDAAALKALDKLARQNPSWELPRLEAARLRLKHGRDLDHAELDLEAARALAPENPRAHLLWAMLCQEQGRVEEAIRSLEEAVALKRDFLEARGRLASLYVQQGRLPEAERQYKTLLAYQPDSVPPRLQLAEVHEKQGQLESAERELRRLLDDHPESVQVRQRLAAFYERTGRPELAEKAFQGTERKSRKLRPLPKSRR